MAFVVRMVRHLVLLSELKPRNCVWPPSGAIPFEDKMSKAQLREGLKPPKEPKPIERKPYTVKASVKKAVKTLKKMSETPGALPL